MAKNIPKENEYKYKCFYHIEIIQVFVIDNARLSY